MTERIYGGRRLSRRKALGGATLLGAGLLAAACRENPGTVSTPVATEPKRGGVLNRRAIRSGVFIRGLDPAVQLINQTGLMGLFYQTLVRINPRTAEIEPELAQKWESPTTSELILTLQPSVRWHNKPPVNGRILTADDVVFNLNRNRTDDPRFLFASLLEPVDRIEAVDRMTVRLRLKNPDVTTLSNLASSSWAMVAPEAVEKFNGKFTTTESAIGTGAFVFERKDDVSGTLARNPDYWKPGLPYLDGVNLRAIQDDEAVWSAFLAGQLDVSFPPGTQAKKILAEQEGKPYYGEWIGDPTLVQFQSNTRVKPFDDARVTRALRLLVDHEEAVIGWAEVWYGRGRLASYLPAALSDWDFTEEEYRKQFLEWQAPKDAAVREAMALLNAAGFDRSNPLTFTLLGSSLSLISSLSELLHAQFRRLGQGMVQTSLRQVETTTLDSLLNKGEFECAATGASPATPYDPGAWLHVNQHSRGGRNYGKYNDPKLDGMVERQRMLFSVEQRKAAVKEIIKYLIERSPFTGWAGAYQATAARHNVKNFAPESEGAIPGYQYEQVWLDT